MAKIEFLKRDLFTEEELSVNDYERLVEGFNLVAGRNPERIDQLTYMDYYKESGEQVAIDKWMDFLTDYRVSNLLDNIMLLNMRSSITRIMNSDEKSVAASQKLTAALNFIGKYFDKIADIDTVTYVYTSVPLTESEKAAENARVLTIKPKKNPYNPAKLSNLIKEGNKK